MAVRSTAILVWFLKAIPRYKKYARDELYLKLFHAIADTDKIVKFSSDQRWSIFHGL
ncbi:hypothetical protein [Pseudanabaena sp. ABRG5-3]|uniref:hypothetical protein n=1 Tax=Pseudanabaena sp. ABRG5-3 TaxID=685565 RepID=UPI0013A66358|nr:hypothetical protein [Pseudanabaena sp. ABRG5-3]